jgi:hypothetical protein
VEVPHRVRGERIGIGRTAEVFAWGDREVIKVLRPGLSDRLGQHEAAIAARVTASGLAAPRLLGTERLDGRFGLVYERLIGPAMLDRLSGHPWLVDSLARQFASLHAQMHDASGSGLPDLVPSVREAIDRVTDDLGPDRRDAALRSLDAVARGSVVCHGDMHPGNVMLTPSGPIVIDWLTARSGPPEADVARTRYLLFESVVPDAYPRIQRLLIEALRRRFARTYLRAYRRLRQVDDHQIALWRLPTLALRLSEGIEAERVRVLAAIDAERDRASG